LKTQGGTDQTYAVRRLKRYRPDLHARVLAGEHQGIRGLLSTRQAAAQTGVDHVTVLHDRRGESVHHSSKINSDHEALHSRLCTVQSRVNALGVTWGTGER
jgi:hypothetical protein